MLNMKRAGRKSRRVVSFCFFSGFFFVFFVLASSSASSLVSDGGCRIKITNVFRQRSRQRSMCGEMELFLTPVVIFVTQARCRGNMSHLRQTWVGSHLEINCVFPTGRERQTFHWPPSRRMFLGF